MKPLRNSVAVCAIVILMFTQASSEEPIRRLPETESAAIDDASDAEHPATRVSFLQPAPLSNLPGIANGMQPGSFDNLFSDTREFDIGVDLNSAPEFEGGLIVYGENVAMKFGGYVKADFIYDFDPIGSSDAFVTTTIPVRGDRFTNARYHAKQTRFSFDTRWSSFEQPIRIFVEGDFFTDGSRYRLRHAYGEVGGLLVGQTWTTFTDVAATPATLDFEGSVSGINRRQAQARWTQPVLHDDLTLGVAIEDTTFIVDVPVDVVGEPRSPSPDFIVRLRLEKEWGRFQVANVYRIGAFQETGDDMKTGLGWGFNFTGVVILTSRNKVYYQILFGDGIGSYRNLPDAVATGAEEASPLGMFGWMVGTTQEWNDRLSSNFTYAEAQLDNLPFQDPDDIRRATYLSANLIWSPLERVNVGIEYLYGLRENVDHRSGSANRLQMAFIFDLP